MDYFAGLDVSVKETSVCIVDDAGKIVREARVASEPEALLQLLTNTIYRFKRVGLEAGPLSQWLYSVLAEAGLPVICVETRHMRAVLKAQINKTDRNDARGMAQMMRAGLYRPVHVKTLRSQKLRVLLTHQACRNTTSPGSEICSVSCRPTRAARSRVASWRLRISIGSRRRALARQLEQVGGVQERPPVLGRVAQSVEHRHPVAVAGHRLPVEQERSDLQGAAASRISGKRADQSRPLRVSSWTPAASRRTIRRKPSCLNLVNPAGAGRRTLGGGWQARLDEAGRRPAGTQQHGSAIAGRRCEVESVNRPSTIRWQRRSQRHANARATLMHNL